MRIVINECKHCGIEYRWQASGSDMPGQYNDHEYCGECKKAIVDALGKIERKFGYKFFDTDEVTLDELLKREEEIKQEHKDKMKEAEERGQVLFPLCRQIFPSLYDTNSGERSVFGRVFSNEGKQYGYFYWPSKKNEAKITIERRYNCQTGEILECKIKR